MPFFRHSNQNKRSTINDQRSTAYSPTDLLPTSKIIKLSKEGGVDFGPGNSNERIRYFIKLGLLPYAVRKTPAQIENLKLKITRPAKPWRSGENSGASAPVGHLPFSCVAKLIEIQNLNEKGLSFPQIAAKFKKQAKSQALGHAETEAESLALGTDPTTQLVVKVSPIETARIQKTLKEHEKKLASLTQEKASKILSGVKSQAFDHAETQAESLAFGKALDLEAKSKLNLKNGLFLLLALTLTSAGTFGTYKHISSKNALKPNPQTAGLTTSGQVLAASSENHKFYIDADTEVTGTTLFEEDITAPNVIYSVTAGTGIAVTGGQNPTVSLDSSNLVSSVNDLTGALTLKASGSTSISKSGSEITISSTSTSESDTLSTVTGRGATTTTAVALNGGLTSSSATPITLSSTAPLLAIGNTGTLAITDATNTLFSVVDQGAYGTIRLTDKASTGDPATCTAGDIYFNATDATVKACTAANTWEALDGAASAMTSFTLSGDTGTDQTITDANTLEVAGGTNGIDTVGTATDTITLNLDTTEIGTTTWSSGSSIVWTFNSGTTDPVLTFGDNVLTIGSAATITATDVTAFNCTDCLNFDDISDSPTLDATTTVAFSTLDLNLNLSSTGVLNIQDGGTTYVSFDDDSTVDVTFPAAGTLGIDATTTASTINAAGVIDLNVTSATDNNRGLDLAYTFNNATASTNGYGIYSAITHSNTTNANTVYGEYQTLVDSTALGNTNFQAAFYGNTTGDGAVTKNVYGVYSGIVNDNTTTDQGTRNTYAGYFTAVGSTRGTATTYGVYTTAATGDTNYGLYSSAGSIKALLGASEQFVVDAATTKTTNSGTGAIFTDINTATSNAVGVYNKFVTSQASLSGPINYGIYAVNSNAATSSTTTLYGIYNLTTDTGATTPMSQSLIGGYTSSSATVASATVRSVYGQIIATTNTGAGDIVAANTTRGLNITATGDTNGTSTTIGIISAASGGDTVYGLNTSSSGTDLSYGIYASSTAGTTSYGLSSSSSSSGTTNYGIYTTSLNGTTNYGIFSTGANTKNYFDATAATTAVTASSNLLYGGTVSINTTTATTNVAGVTLAMTNSLGTAHTQYGLYNSFTDTTAWTAGSTLYGTYNLVQKSGANTGTIGAKNVLGNLTWVNDTSTSTTAYQKNIFGIEVYGGNSGATGSTVPNTYGVYASVVSDGGGTTPSTYAGYFIATGGSTNYGIYSSSAAASNFFAQTANTTAISTASSLYTGGVMTIQDTTSTTGAGSLVVSTLQNASTAASNYGIYNIFASTTGVTAISPTSQYYGIYNSVTNSGADNFTTSGIEEMYGLYIKAANTSTDAGVAGTRKTFGVYSNASSGGTSYGGMFAGGTYGLYVVNNLFVQGGGAGTVPLTIYDDTANRTTALIDINNTGAGNGFIIAGGAGIKNVTQAACSGACYGNYLSTNVYFANGVGPYYGLYNTYTDTKNYTSSVPTTAGLYNNVSVTGGNTLALATTVSYGIFNKSTLTGGTTADATAVLNYGIYSATTSDTTGPTVGYALYVTSTGADAGSNYNIFSTAANSTSQFLNTATTTATTATSSLLNGGVVNIQNTTATAGVSTLNVSTVNTSNNQANMANYGIYNTWTSSTALASGSTGNPTGIYNLVTKTGTDDLGFGSTANYYGIYSLSSITGGNGFSTRTPIGGYFEGITDQLSLTNNAYGVWGRASGGDNNIGVLGIVNSTGNAARNHYGVYGQVSSNSTTADALLGAYLASSATGNAARTANYGAIIYGNTASTTADTVYGIYGTANSNSAATIGTKSVYGVYSIATEAAGNGSSSNVYGGIFSAVGTTSGTGSTYGIYVSASGGDIGLNYGIYMGTAPNTASTTALCWDNAGASEVSDCNGSATDLAENYGTTDDSIEGGDVVVLTGEATTISDPHEGKPTTKAFVTKTSEPYQASILGVVSTNPNLIFGDDGVFQDDENPRPVSLSGRIPVKVNTENGPIAPGDLLTSSSTAGVAMKADPAKGSTIGKALSSFAGPGQGTVIMLVENNTRYNLASALQNTDLNLQSLATTSGNTTIDALGNITTAGTIQAAGGLFEVDNLGNVTANSLDLTGDATIGGNLVVNGQLLIVNGVKTSSIQSLASTDLNISLSGTSTSTLIRFTDAMNNELFTINQSGDATFAGTISADAFVTNATADLAEHFPNVTGDLQAGDIAAVDENNKESIQLSNQPYQPTILGVISTDPGINLNVAQIGGKLLALAGRVPVKVNLENGSIKAGDPITSSSTAGVGMRATQPGRVIGMALENFDGSQCNNLTISQCNNLIMVFVNPGWYLGASLAANGSFDFAKSQALGNAETSAESLAFRLNDQRSEVLNHAINPDGTLALNDEPSTLNDQQIKDLVATEVSKQLALYQQTPAPNVLAASTEVDSPVPTPTTDSCNAKSQALGNAETQEKSLALNEATASSEASLSTVYPETTRGEISCSIEEGTALAAETQSTLDELTKLLSTACTEFTECVNLEPSTLTVTGSTNLASVQTAGTFSQDGTFIIDYGKQLNVLGNTLYLQNDPLAGSPSCHSELDSESRCGILIDIGNGKLTLDKLGTLAVKSAVTDNLETKQITIDTSDKNAQTIGSSTIAAGKVTITIFTTALQPNAKVLITPSGPTGGRALYVQNKAEFEGFTVALDGTVSTKPIDFDWLIVNTTQVSSR